MVSSYRGRFAPSPTGPLHAGSLVAALASWLDARAHSGVWLVRIEDVDTPRCIPGADTTILQQLALCGLVPDEAPVWQSQRGALYQQALDQLVRNGLAYPCGCSRKDIEETWAARGVEPTRHSAMPYPGTCRDGLHGRAARAWRLKVGLDSGIFKPNKPPAPAPPAQAAINTEANNILHWHDRRLGAQQQDVAREVGDFILKRADGLWAYQLAVVVDDAAQGITHIVRGEDLADNTPRQIVLQQALGACRAWSVESENQPQRGQFAPDLQAHSMAMGQKNGEKWTAAVDLQPTISKPDRLLNVPTPHYLHTPLVRAADGEKLSKQNGAQPLDLADPLAALNLAAAMLGLPPAASDAADALRQWVPAWQALYNPVP